MLSSGITAIRALEILKERDFNPKLKQVYEKLYKDVQQGLTISEAMRLQGRTFPELLMNMFASGEASGQLESVADKMSIQYEKEHRLNGKIKSAMRYPKILGVVTLIVVLLIFLLVLPNFFAMLEGFNLPLITRIIIAISGFLMRRWYIVLIVGLIAVALVQYLLLIPAVRYAFDKLKLKMPVIGKLVKIIYTARFSRTLSSLYSSGVSMIRALEITGTIISNKYIEGQFPDFIKNVRNGEPLSASVRGIIGFDNKLSNTILVGEESGRLDSMLTSTADSFDYEAEMATAKIVAMAEPIMLIIMAFVIGSVLLSVMLPLVTMYNTIGSM